MTSIYTLAYKNDVHGVRELLASDPKAVNQQNSDDHSLLYWAACSNSKETVQLLLTSGAKVDLHDKDGQSPLHKAAYNNSTETAQLLLASGANVDLQDQYGRSPLYMAAYYKSNETAQLLLASGARVDLQDMDGFSPLYKAAYYNYKETAQILLAAGANVDLQDKEGKSTIMIAQDEGHGEMVTLLEQHRQHHQANNEPPLTTTATTSTTPLINEPVDKIINKSNKTPSAVIHNTPSTESNKIISNINRQIQVACQMKTRKWNRSKIMIVGEGRAGKTALANSIIGSGFKETASTIGINNLSCAISYTDVSNEQWNLYDRPEKELETAIAMSILEKKINEQQPRKMDIKQNNSIKKKTKINTVQNIKTSISTKVAPTAATTAVVIPAIAIPKAKDIDNDFVAKRLADNIQTSSDLIISLFDFGGQSVFDVIHHLFLTPFGVYIVVFNMTWLVEGATESDRASCWARLEGWVNSIVMHTSEDSRSSSGNGSGSSTVSSSAPIVFVGTCKDKVTEATADFRTFMQDVSTQLRSMVDITTTPVIKNTMEELWFFPVDNIKGRSDSSLTSMLQSIEVVMKQSEYVIQEKPLIWLQALDKLKAKKDITSYTMMEVSEILSSCSIEKSSFSEVLSFFNKMGELLWIDENYLRDTIIMDPISFFVTPATRVICKHVDSQERGETFCHEDRVHLHCKHQFPLEWQSMVTSGILQGELLKALVGIHFEIIINLMIKFGLIVVVLSPDGTGDGKVPADSTKYIVPSILHPKTVSTQEQKHSSISSLIPNELPVSIFFSFSLPNKSSSWNKPLTESQLASEGFLPQGLFLRYLGKLLTWSQLITLGYDALSTQICNNDVTIFFGTRSFRIRVFDSFNSICVTVIRGGNSAALLHRLKGILSEVISECFGRLHFEIFLLHFETEIGLTTPTMSTSIYFIPLDLISKAYKGSQPVILSENLCLDRVLLQEYYLKWLKLYDTSQDCDVFLSYRWGEHDKQFVSLIYDALLDSDFSFVFLDDHVMEVGNNLQDTFTKALISAKVFVPFCSHDALTRMRSHNPQTVDNVLLEWIIALECQKKASLNILPMPYGSINEETPFMNFDREKWIWLLPEKTPLKTIEKAVNLLTLYRLNPSSEIYNLTVRDIVVNILNFTYSFQAKEFRRLKECIPSCIASIRQVHTAWINTCRLTGSLSIVNPPSADSTATTTTTNDDTASAIVNQTISSIDVEEAWGILNNAKFLVDQENSSLLKSFLEDLGAYESNDLILCEENDIIMLADKLKKVPRLKFLKALRK